MLLYKLIYYGTPFEFYGGYASPQSGSLPAPTATYEPFTQNATYYYEAFGYKIYNSAILSYGGSFWVMAVFPSSCYVAKYTGNNLSENLNYNLGNNGAYTESVQRETVGGIEIVRNRLWSGFSPSETDLPIFTDPQAYMDYITSPVVLYNWTSVEGLYGNQISLGLSQIKDEFIGDGSPVNLAPDTNIERLTQASRMDNIFANIGENFVPIAYAGDNYIAARVYYENDYYQYEELAFFTADNDTTPIYSYHINTDYNKKYLQIIYDDDAEAARVSIIKDLGSNTCSYNQESFDQTTEHNLWLWLHGNQDGDSGDPYGEGSDDDGGDNFGLTPEDPLPFQSMPTASGLATGLFTVYNPTDTELQYLADFLWDPDAIGVLEKLFTEPENAIIAFYMLPVAPDHTGNKQLKLANANVPNCTGVKYLTDGSDGSGRYKEINFGSFSLKPKFDSYLDFNPYTTLKIYLPYIGVQNLNVDEFMCPAQASGAIGKTGYNNTFTLKYRIDLVTGVVSAFILRNNNVRYQFTGKCGMTLPITGRNYDNAISGILTAVAGVATTVASGGATAPMVAGASATAAGTVSAIKERVYHSGNLSGEASIFAYDTPYLIITRPNIPESTKDTKKFVGLPSYKTQNTLSSFSGFTKVFDAHIDNVSCTDEEKNEILQLLKEGVII